MPFDGRTYTALPLIPPVNHAPRSPGNGGVLGDALRIAYMHARTNARLIGQQTFASFRPNLYGRTEQSVRNTTWVDVASFACYLPSCANIVGARLAWRTYGTAASEVTIHTRVVVTDGVDTDTGEDTQVITKTQPQPEQYSFLDLLGLNDDRDDPRNGESLCSVVLADVIPTGLASAATVTVQSYATHGGDSAAFRPRLVSAWWWSNG